MTKTDPPLTPSVVKEETFASDQTKIKAEDGLSPEDNSKSKLDIKAETDSTQASTSEPGTETKEPKDESKPEGAIDSKPRPKAKEAKLNPVTDSATYIKDQYLELGPIQAYGRGLLHPEVL